MKTKDLKKSIVIKVPKGTKKYSMPETRTVRLHKKRLKGKRSAAQTNRVPSTATGTKKH